MVLKKEINSFHIGKLIRAQLKKVGMPISVIAGKLSISPPKVYYLLNKKSLDAEMLQKISVALDYDFFQHYLGLQTFEDCSFLFMQNPADVQRDLTIARNEMKVVLKHNGYLKEIIQLMDRKAELAPRRKFKYKSPNKPRKIKSVFKITTPVPENSSEVSPSRFIEY